MGHFGIIKFYLKGFCEGILLMLKQDLVFVGRKNTDLGISSKLCLPQSMLTGM